MGGLQCVECIQSGKWGNNECSGDNGAETCVTDLTSINIQELYFERAKLYLTLLPILSL